MRKKTMGTLNSKIKDITITCEDIEWEMNWVTMKENPAFKDNKRILELPDVEIIFEQEAALAYLIASDKVFINNHWWDEELTEKQKQLISINVNCNDVFMWGCADAEEMFYKDIKSVWWHHKVDPEWGTDVWCIKKRGMMPQKPVYESIQLAGIWNLDEMGLDKNV